MPGTQPFVFAASRPITPYHGNESLFNRKARSRACQREMKRNGTTGITTALDTVSDGETHQAFKRKERRISATLSG